MTLQGMRPQSPNPPPETAVSGATFDHYRRGFGVDKPANYIYATKKSGDFFKKIKH